MQKRIMGENFGEFLIGKISSIISSGLVNEAQNHSDVALVLHALSD